MYKQHHEGQAAEHFACAYLKKQGLKLQTKNFRCKMGEIDLIMLDKKQWVFVEVRLRNNLNFGNGLESITAHKQQKLLRSAQFYIQCYAQKNLPSCRFDVVSLARKEKTYEVSWLKNAFYDE